jgi:hypothetical protein
LYRYDGALFVDRISGVPTDVKIGKWVKPTFGLLSTGRRATDVRNNWSFAIIDWLPVTGILSFLGETLVEMSWLGFLSMAIICS